MNSQLAPESTREAATALQQAAAGVRDEAGSNQAAAALDEMAEWIGSTALDDLRLSPTQLRAVIAELCFAWANGFDRGTTDESGPTTRDSRRTIGRAIAAATGGR